MLSLAREVVVRLGELGGDPRVFGRRRVEAERLELGPFRLDLAGELGRAELVDEDLDPRLVDVVAPAVAVVDAQDRLAVAQILARPG